ncbi:MAG TPA: transferrin-binding protein-like solute binding protein [Rhizomicrobium sp.]|nr:transferrin-binding protein-like solute binding protein [Rhizomicrobium sp.]
MAFDLNLSGKAVPADTVISGGATLTYNGLSGSFGSQRRSYELKIPALDIDAVVMQPQGNDRPLSNGYGIFLTPFFLNYMLAGSWNLSPSDGHATLIYGDFVTGFQTPVSAVPSSGQGIYSTSLTNSAGAVIVPQVSGTILFSPYGSVVVGSVSGNATITVNFPDGSVSGMMTNMFASNLSGVPGTGAWNDVRLTGTLSGAALSGTTAAASPPAVAMAFDMNSTGTFDGALFGPTGQELGLVWTLHDPTGEGKTAFGFIAVGKTN